MIYLTLKKSLIEKIYLGLHHLTFFIRSKRQKYFSEQYVISVGNLTLGGTGKTPTTSLIADYLNQKKQEFIIILRGYKALYSRQGILVNKEKHTVSEVGDEAILLVGHQKRCVAIGKNRKKIIQKYAQEKKYVILDDAFQNPSIYKNHNIVLLDASIDIEKERIFPIGNMREDISALQRADTVLLTKCNQKSHSQNIEKLRDYILAYKKEESIFYSQHKALGLYPCALQKNNSTLAPKELGAFCGIGRPRSFFQSLESLNYHIVSTQSFPDHYNFQPKDIKSLASQGPKAWVCTAKDMTRLTNSHLRKEFTKILEDTNLKIYVLEIGIEILNHQKLKFLKRVCQI